MSCTGFIGQRGDGLLGSRFHCGSRSLCRYFDGIHRRLFVSLKEGHSLGGVEEAQNASHVVRRTSSSERSSIECDLLRMSSLSVPLCASLYSPRCLVSCIKLAKGPRNSQAKSVVLFTNLRRRQDAEHRHQEITSLSIEGRQRWKLS